MTIYQVQMTVDSREVAQNIIDAVVGERLAACGQLIGPITSTYWWKDTLEQAQEWLCLMKTTPETYLDLEQRIRSLHPYEVPEIVIIPIDKGNPAYLEWCVTEVGKREALQIEPVKPDATLEISETGDMVGEEFVPEKVNRMADMDG